MAGKGKGKLRGIGRMKTGKANMVKTAHAHAHAHARADAPCAAPPPALWTALTLALPLPLLAAFILSLAASLPARGGELAKIGETVRLRAKVRVRGPLVRLGDLFAGLEGDKASIAVFRSPRPGTTGHVSGGRILRAARKHGVKPAALSGPAGAKIAISRASRIVELDEIRDILRQEMLRRAMNGHAAKAFDARGGGELEISFSAPRDKIHLAPDHDGEIALAALEWNRRSGAFTARLEAGEGESFAISGKAAMMVELAAPTRSIKAGESISAGDLELRKIPLRRLDMSAMASMEQILGKAARRTLPKGRPVRLVDLREPYLVRKNQLVTILLEAGPLVLRTRGKALSDAARGQSLRVMNIASKRIIEATARKEGLVAVSLNATGS
jgi:flagella basal body P-ring formation protein FlgA